jgi:hypothetical protein
MIAANDNADAFISAGPGRTIDAVVEQIEKQSFLKEGCLKF